MRGLHLHAICSLGNGIRNEDRPSRIGTESGFDSGSPDMWASLSVFLENEQKGQVNSSESLLELSSSLLDDTEVYLMEKEDPPEYIPAPVQSGADLECSRQLENVLYILRDVLPGPVQKIGIDDKLHEAWELVHDEIKIQDPLMCFQGKDKLRCCLYALALANVHVELHDIYAKRSIAATCENCVYAIWTITFPGHIQATSKPHNFEREEESMSKLSLSGEAKFGMHCTGQVISIISDWMVTKGSEEVMEAVKNYLAWSLHKEML
ncbi:hypothetical protein KP509_25G039900 [Ceratopteris richardii]|uniref:Uncharacterized protein n=1 Tax=Ceratopteris richardii TaxID=49495 RepID=A0A8T2RPM1_CERRI|nr:hypothetical protein KP509_25G039900 [Ceratopteris richardii]